MIKLWSIGGSGGAPWWTYWSAGITNTIGPAMGIEALKYISYPAQVTLCLYRLIIQLQRIWFYMVFDGDLALLQVLAKSSKMIPGEVSM